jgi:hypothetical protein
VRRERRRTTKRINRKVREGRKGKSKTKPTTGDAEKTKGKASTAEYAETAELCREFQGGFNKQDL